VQAIKSATVPC